MFSLITITLYLAAWVFLVHNVIRREQMKTKAVSLVILAGLIIHCFSVYFSIHSNDGIKLGTFKISSLFFVVINAIVWLSSIKKPLLNLFLGLLPLSVISIISSLVFDSPITRTEDLSPGLLTHILLSILAYSLLTIASLQAILLAYQNKKLRSRHPGAVMGLMPPLQTMETLLFELVWGGMLFLTLSIVTGFMFVDDFMAQKLSHKSVFSVLSWAIYAILLTGRHFIGWRGMTAIRWVLGGFVALMLAYFGSKLVLEVIIGVN